MLLLFDIELFDIELFDIGVEVIIGLAELFIIELFVARLFIIELFDIELFATSPGQAAPMIPNVNTAERANAFFISVLSPVFLKITIYLFLFNDRPRTVEFPKNLLSKFFGNIGQYK